MTAPGDRKGSAVIVDIANGARVTRPTRPIPITARPRPTSDIASDPKKLLRYLSDLEAHLAELEALTASNIFGSGVLIQNIAMTGAGAQLVEHRLRRPFIGCFWIRVQASGATIPRICERVLPTGRDSSQWINLEADQPCTLDVMVF